MRRIILYSFVAVLFPWTAFAQSLTLEECLTKAKANYPQVKQYGLIEQTQAYNLSNAGKNYLPQLSVSAKATYQSDVTGLPSSLATMLENVTHQKISNVSKDQYQAVLEANQLIWDGGATQSQKKMTEAGSSVDTRRVDVDLYALNERVEQVYFGVLLMDEQLKQVAILKDELQTNVKKLNAYKLNGVANQADVDAISVEVLNADQKETELQITRKAYLTILGAYMGAPLNEDTELQKPLASMTTGVNRRPELSLFEAQHKLYDSQVEMLHAGNMPRLGAFVQGGIGKPALNMFVNQFSPFYIAGLRFSWNLSGFYTQKNNLSKIEAGKKAVDVQRETFLFNTDLKTQQQKAEIEKLQSSVQSDHKIIALRSRIKTATSARLENGTCSVSDLIRDLNAENQAKQTQSLHEVQLLMSIYQLKNNLNN